MFALAAAVLLFLVAFGVRTDVVDLFILALGFWALHFVWSFAPWSRR